MKAPGILSSLKSWNEWLLTFDHESSERNWAVLLHFFEKFWWMKQ
jgi:hypothetical protein